ncbi:MAG: hypothetical protein M0Z46_12555 [Actinomycetota bacterium]|jgi:hypothetical protein|nr:hypothetical protein [Actinomycetota bacterium]
MPSADRYQREKDRLARRGITPYGERVSRLEALGLTRSQAAGHPRPNETPARELFSQPDYRATIYVGVRGDPDNPPRVISFWTDRPTDVRAGRYMALTRALREERITPTEFRRKVRRMRPIGGMRPLDDPEAVLALIQTTAREDITFEYRGRARPRRGGSRRRSTKRGRK